MQRAKMKMAAAKEKHFNTARTRARMESYMKEAALEQKAYLKKRSNVAILAEGGEKLWGAVNYLLELKVNRSVRSNKEAKAALKEIGDPRMERLYDDAFLLHTFFYGWTENMEKIEDTFARVLKALSTLASGR